MIQKHYRVVLPSQLLQLLELVNYYFELLGATVQSHASSAPSLYVDGLCTTLRNFVCYNCIR